MTKREIAKKNVCERHERFINECNKILDVFAPSIDPITKKVIVAKIGLLRSEMELESSNDIFESVVEAINGDSKDKENQNEEDT